METFLKIAVCIAVVSASLLIVQNALLKGVVSYLLKKYHRDLWVLADSPSVFSIMEETQNILGLRSKGSYIAAEKIDGKKVVFRLIRFMESLEKLVVISVGITSILVFLFLAYKIIMRIEGLV